MADGVDTTMKSVESAGLEAPLDLTPREPEHQKLPTGHHPVLRAGERGDLVVTWTLFSTHTVV